MPDERKDKRTLLSLKIRYKSATLEDFIERYSSDISRGGVFIKAKKPLAVGTLLKFEFMLQDQSSVIHGVGRVVWRREEGDAANPPGMGIKFVKMDPASRAIVQRIAEERVLPGVFEQGKEGVQLDPSESFESDSPAEQDRTKVRHVSEFLASALEEGGAGAAATREAHAGAERARQISNQVGDNRAVAARGAFSANDEIATQKRHSISDAPARGAMSAFGRSGVGASARISSAAAPAMEELDAEDDFLDDETTKIHENFESGYPADADATVIAKEAAAPFLAERRPTPVMPASQLSPLESAVPDLFGADMADSFGPAPGEFIDASLLDPAVQTVPPPAAAVPEAPGIPAEAFKVSRATEPVWTTRPTPPKTQVSRGLPGLVVFLFLVVGGGLAVWQLGFVDDLIALASPSSARPASVAKAPAAPAKKVAVAVPTPAKQLEEPAGEAEPTEEAPAVAEIETATQAAAAEPTEPAEAAVVKFRVTSEPSGAYLSINGKGVGRTPLDLEYEAGTKLTMFSKARGYLARRTKVTVEGGQAPVNFVFSPLPYVVEVITVPAGAKASSAGAGQVTTPGALQFRSMPDSRTIVVSMDGYKSANETVSRADFIEEPRRMAAAVNVKLQKDGAAQAAQPAKPKTESATAAPAPVEPTPVESTPAAPEAEAAAPPPPAPKAVKEAPAPSETIADDVP